MVLRKLVFSLLVGVWAGQSAYALPIGFDLLEDLQIERITGDGNPRFLMEFETGTAPLVVSLEETEEFEADLELHPEMPFSSVAMGAATSCVIQFWRNLEEGESFPETAEVTAVRGTYFVHRDANWMTGPELEPVSIGPNSVRQRNAVYALTQIRFYISDDLVRSLTCQIRESRDWTRAESLGEILNRIQGVLLTQSKVVE